MNLHPIGFRPGSRLIISHVLLGLCAFSSSRMASFHFLFVPISSCFPVSGWLAMYCKIRLESFQESKCGPISQTVRLCTTFFWILFSLHSILNINICLIVFVIMRRHLITCCIVGVYHSEWYGCRVLRVVVIIWSWHFFIEYYITTYTNLSNLRIIDGYKQYLVKSFS